MKYLTTFIIGMFLCLPLSARANDAEGTAATPSEPTPLDQILSRSPKVTKKPAVGAEPAPSPHDQTMSFQEHSAALKRYCRTSFNDPKCLEFHKELGKAHKMKLSEICKADPLHEKCLARTQRSIDDVYEVEAYCNANPSGQGCKTKRKRLLEGR